MMGFNRSVGLAAAILALCLAGPARAEENLDSGKTGAQLFASDCAICHKDAASLAKGGGLFGLSDFLSEHYTASSRSASLIAAYVESVARAQPKGRRSGATKRTAKGDEKAKAGEKKLGTPRSGEAKSGKLAGPKTSEPKTSEPKTSEPKTSEPKTSEPKTSEPPTSAPKPLEAIPSQSNSDASPAAKTDKPGKSD